MTRLTALGIPLIASFGLLACAREVRAEVPKPPPGGHAFDVELVETDGSGVRTTQHFVLSTAGDSACGKLATHEGRDSTRVTTCLMDAPGLKNALSVEIARTRSDHTTNIEGRVPLAPGSRLLVGRADQGTERVEVFVTSV